MANQSWFSTVPLCVLQDFTICCTFEFVLLCPTSKIASPIFAGDMVTTTPASFNASIFASAPPLPPAMIAPACPGREGREGREGKKKSKGEQLCLKGEIDLLILIYAKMSGHDPLLNML